MESLLQLAFNNLSSYDAPKIKKGLKQVEGLLAQICLVGAGQKHHARRGSTVEAVSSASLPAPKALGDLGADPAFREFFKLQEGFEWNVAQQLIMTLDWLTVRGTEGQYDFLILHTLDLLQGVLLLHPPSKHLFSRPIFMNVRTYLGSHRPLKECRY